MDSLVGVTNQGQVIAEGKLYHSSSKELLVYGKNL